MPLAAAPAIDEQLRDVVVAALRAYPDARPDFLTGLERFAGQATPESWRQLFAYASYHGVLGVLQAAIADYPNFPAQAREEADRRHAVEQLWHAHIASELETVVGLLSRQGIVALALKGPALAARLYPSPAMRQGMDIDLLVQPEEFDRAADVLGSAGYVSETGASASYLRRYGHHLTFTKPGSVPVELHFQSYAGFGIVLPAGALLDRAHSMQLSDSVSVKVASPEDEFLYLATHAAGHSFVRLVWVYDLKLLVRRYPTLDWNELAHRARMFHLDVAVEYSVGLLRRWLGVGPPLPAWPQERTLRIKAADRLLGEASRPHGVGVRDNLGGLVFTGLLCDSVPRSVTMVGHHLGRALRRRLQRMAPQWLPSDWSA
jgi:hypothetical protein